MVAYSSDHFLPMRSLSAIIGERVSTRTDFLFFVAEMEDGFCFWIVEKCTFSMQMFQGMIGNCGL